MPCELFNRCNFFKLALADMPKAADYIKDKLCFGDYTSCTRYIEFKLNNMHGKPTADLFKDDSETLRLTIPDKIKDDADCRDVLNLLTSTHRKD